jgi:hypothetical protein
LSKSYNAIFKATIKKAKNNHDYNYHEDDNYQDQENDDNLDNEDNVNYLYLYFRNN